MNLNLSVAKGPREFLCFLMKRCGHAPRPRRDDRTDTRFHRPSRRFARGYVPTFCLADGSLSMIGYHKP